ncbi:periplasmic nitrate reductase electron transfer subunit [Saccharobesus litoralis]|uniref:Periplasmic nitrate reductase, electron transfer subunit n=1 Tax=Saccharobesus litoralis TaxID=2172099 RepID=A0A2S0VRT0_9ALTE|nr:nitrate reductase cytochrome c-type subunit [Saccharobesus litoralis]AWB66872.1 periplasmic nitrate reductase electron transfer subunit [Saccharobesus litoralis]
MKLINKKWLSIVAVAFVLPTLSALAGDSEIATLRKDTQIEQQKTPKVIPKVVNTDVKQKRSYPMQPPVIPHQTRNYEVNLNANKCMSCHSRERTQESQAPMVSVTHFMDRDGNFLAEISPRRYFCNQCHVTQKNAQPLIDNNFTDMQSLMKDKLTNTKLPKAK